jgi:hypothetical protein
MNCMLKKVRKSMKVIERKIYESYCITLVRKDAKEEALKNTFNLITSVKNTRSGFFGGNYITENPNVSGRYVFPSNFLRTPVREHV